ncbi:hypothetical protein L4D76_24460 [Photobacterium sagamiensis]|uniref:hypothetical protein n=1 Tax=Photobacterium sagamiensis TaxID=2910241 RepID=UPI003D1496E6
MKSSPFNQVEGDTHWKSQHSDTEVTVSHRYGMICFHRAGMRCHIAGPEGLAIVHHLHPIGLPDYELQTDELDFSLALCKEDAEAIAKLLNIETRCIE